MTRLVMPLLLAFVTALTITGCRTAPVYNVDNATVVASTKGDPNSEQVRKAIIRAGSTLGWRIADEGKDHLVGTLVLRDHVAKVDINYSPKSYSITYKDSENLKYDGTTIHSNYNGWIQNLQRNIDTQLSLL